MGATGPPTEYSPPANNTFINVTSRSHAQVESCLANKHIVFLGDSRVRYQYMQMVDFLKNKHWMRCLDDLPESQTKAPEQCMLINEKFNMSRGQPLGGWSQWYKVSNNLVQDDNQTEVCDCYRAAKFVHKTTVENRFLRRDTPYGSIRMTYLQGFSPQVQVHTNEFDFANPFDKDLPCEPGNCTQKLTILPLSNFLSTLLPEMKPTHFVAHSGWKDEDITCELANYSMGNPSVHVTYINNPLHRGTKTWQRKELKCVDQLSFINREVMTIDVEESWYWDKVHTLSVVNRAFSEATFDQICGPLASAE